MDELIFSSETISAFFTAGLITLLLPIAAVVIFKIKNKEVKLRYSFIGAGTFAVAVLILEQLLHSVMLPFVSESTALYVLYSVLCAGIFEETARYIVFRCFCKKEREPKNAVMYGLGHGGFEAIMLVGVNMLSYAVLAISINALGTDFLFYNISSAETQVALIFQLAALSKIGMGDAIMSVVERLIAMTFHTAASVTVFASVKTKGKKWLFPISIFLHALMDIPAALYQKGVIENIVIAEILMAFFTALTVFLAYKAYKSLMAEKNDAENVEEQV